MKSNIHFIIGIWRSGTTLLREVLGMSEAVKIFPEHFILLNHLKGAKTFSNSFKKEMLQNISNNPDFIHFAKPNLQLLEEKFNRSNNFREAILSSYQACITEQQKVELFIDKNPIYSYYLPELMELFPQAKFVWMLREPKDNCISRAKHDIQSFKNYSYLATWWNMTNEKIAEQAKKFPHRFLLVSYDDMVSDPEPWIKKITDFLEIPFVPEMLAFEKKKKERLTDFVLAAKARDGEISEEYAQRKKAMWENLQKPINASKTKQWEKALSQKEINQIDRVSKSYYEQLLENNYNFTPNYPLVYKALTDLSLVKLKWDIKRKALS